MKLILLYMQCIEHMPLFCTDRCFTIFRQGIGKRMKGYNDPVATVITTALIENGVYADIISCDYQQLVSTDNSITVIPGRHTVELALRVQQMGYYAVYSRETALVSFNAEMGHSYVAYAEIIGNESWIARIKDKMTNEQCTQSSILPVVIEPHPF